MASVADRCVQLWDEIDKEIDVDQSYLKWKTLCEDRDNELDSSSVGIFYWPEYTGWKLAIKRGAFSEALTLIATVLNDPRFGSLDHVSQYHIRCDKLKILILMDQTVHSAKEFLALLSQPRKDVERIILSEHVTAALIMAKRANQPFISIMSILINVTQSEVFSQLTDRDKMTTYCDLAFAQFLAGKVTDAVETMSKAIGYCMSKKDYTSLRETLITCCVYAEKGTKVDISFLEYVSSNARKLSIDISKLNESAYTDYQALNYLLKRSSIRRKKL